MAAWPHTPPCDTATPPFCPEIMVMRREGASRAPTLGVFLAGAFCARLDLARHLAEDVGSFPPSSLALVLLSLEFIQFLIVRLSAFVPRLGHGRAGSYILVESSFVELFVLCRTARGAQEVLPNRVAAG